MARTKSGTGAKAQAERSLREQIRSQVMKEHAQEIDEAGFWKRILLWRRIGQEVRRRMAKASPGAAR